MAYYSIAIEGAPGDRIEECAQEAFDQLGPAGSAHYVWLIFNGVPLRVSADDSVESVVAEYHKALRRSA